MTRKTTPTGMVMKSEIVPFENIVICRMKESKIHTIRKTSMNTG